MDSDDHEHRTNLRHFVRNQLAAVRNAAFYLQRRTEGTDLWRSDPRFAQFFAVIADSVQAIDAEITAVFAPSPAPVPMVAGPRAGLREARVLVVDDHLGARATICALLADEGAHVDEASSIVDAEALLTATQRYDLVVLDRGLGERDGIELVPNVRARHPHAKIVVSTGGAADAVPFVDATIGKELDFDQVLTRLRDVLAR